jgi:hypothetical protein
MPGRSDLLRRSDQPADASALSLPGSRPFRKSEWVVYAKPPFGGPEAVLAYLSRYTHRVAISNRRLISADADTVTFRWKDYRIKRGDRMKVMRLATGEFIRRFLIHVLPDGFHRIRHYGLLASAGHKTNIANRQTLRSSRSRWQNHARTAAGQCASSRHSSAAKSLEPGRHRDRRRHDTRPVKTPKADPGRHRIPGAHHCAAMRAEHR